MPIRYQSGEEIRKGDKVLLHNLSGEVDFVADPALPDPKTSWYVKEFGGGVMILEPTAFGSAFVSRPDEDDDLEFVSRGD